MDTLHPRSDWESVGDKWFRKTQLYTAVFDQDLDLDNYVVTGAPYAGALGEFDLLSYLTLPTKQACLRERCYEAVQRLILPFAFTVSEMIMVGHLLT